MRQVWTRNDVFQIGFPITPRHKKSSGAKIEAARTVLRPGRGPLPPGRMMPRDAADTGTYPLAYSAVNMGRRPILPQPARGGAPSDVARSTIPPDLGAGGPR